MNPKNYHTPITPDSPRRRCPVCHQAVYSTAGIHPQCAMAQSEPPKPKKKPPGQEAAVVTEAPAGDVPLAPAV